MKILYVSQYFPPEMGAPAARAAELARHWARAGHEVTILTGFPNHPTGRVAAEYRRYFRRLLMREEFSGATVLRSWLWPLPNGRAHERILNYSSFCISSMLSGLLVARPDVVIATSPQLLVGLSGYWLARCKGVPFVFEVRDLWPESLAAVGMDSQHSALHRSLAKLAGFLYRHADHIVVVSPAFRQHLTEQWAVEAGKISVVENGVETDVFRPQLTDPGLRKELGAEGRYLVSYIGTVGMAHGLDTLIAAAEQLRTSMPRALFLVIGEGADRERIEGLVLSQNLGNVVFMGGQPREKIPALIAASDVCVVLLKKAELFKTVIPTKMLEFMACARPIILGVDGQARKILEGASAGIFVDPGNSTALAQAITRLASGNGLGDWLGHNGRRYIVEHLSRERTANAYLELLRKLLNGSQRALAGRGAAAA